MRILLDENIEPEVEAVLVALRHTVARVTETPYRSVDDITLRELAEQFDVFVTLDLHRQLPEWLAVNEAMVRRRVNVLRIRLAKTSLETLAAVAAAVVGTAPRWTQHFEDGACLVTIRERTGKEPGYTVTALTPEQVEELLRTRGYQLD